MLFLKSSPRKLASVIGGENIFLRLNNCVEYGRRYHGCVLCSRAVCSWRHTLGSIPKMDFDCCDSTTMMYFNNDGLQSRICLHNIDHIYC